MTLVARCFVPLPIAGSGPVATTVRSHRARISGLLAGGSPGFRIFFSVQRLHGFRQVVTHVQLQQKDEL